MFSYGYQLCIKMKKLLKIVGIIIGSIVIIIIGIVVYISVALPNTGKAPDIKVEITPARLERGEYLANHIALCMDCHSTREWDKFAGPPKPGTLGVGGEAFTRDMGLPGDYYARNITPYGIGNWTDGEIFRAITSGVSKDGHALFPIMPYFSIAKMPREDIYSIIAYLRSLKPVKSDVPKSTSDFPFNIILHTIPKKAEVKDYALPTDPVAYGKYLTLACIECHTRDNKGQIIPEFAFSGGREFPMQTGGIVRSANITPDKETGIGNWSEEMFLDRFKYYADSSYVPAHIDHNEFNTVMPWTMIAEMKTEDLKAIYSYLQTVKPISNKVTKFTPGKD